MSRYRIVTTPPSSSFNYYIEKREGEGWVFVSGVDTVETGEIIINKLKAALTFKPEVIREYD